MRLIVQTMVCLVEKKSEDFNDRQYYLWYYWV